MGLLSQSSKNKVIIIAAALTLSTVVTAQAQTLSKPLYQNWKGIQNSVALGDEITLDPSSLSDAGNKFTVGWSQGLKSRKADYIQTAAILMSGGSDDFLTIFVQKDRVEAFLAKCGVGTDTYCSMRVDRDFQFGQSSNQSGRFLVFHDKSFKPYARRFINSGTGDRFKRTGGKLKTALYGPRPKATHTFEAIQYLRNNRSKLYGNDSYLQEMKSETPAAVIKAELGRMSNPLKKVELVDRKSLWCYDSVSKIFGKRGKLSDGSISDPSKVYTDRCRQWEKSAWMTLASAPKSNLKPEDILKPEQAFRQCKNWVDENHGHRSQVELRKRNAAFYKCSLQRKLDMLAMGADPIQGFDFRPGPALNTFFASGKWRVSN